MKLNYHRDTDSLYIDLSELPSVESREIAEGVVLDFDIAGNLVGLDIDNARKKVRRLPTPLLQFLEPVHGDRELRHALERLDHREPVTVRVHIPVQRAGGLVDVVDERRAACGVRRPASRVRLYPVCVAGRLPLLLLH